MPRTADPALQAARREALYREHRPMLRLVFDDDGGYRVPPDPEKTDPRVRGRAIDPRESAWHSYPAFSGNADDIKLGNAILRRTDFLPGYDFFTSSLVKLWVRHESVFDDGVRAKATQCIDELGPEQMASPGFVGMNDNFGAMAVVSLVLAGTITNRADLVHDGIAKMRKLVARLDTHGAIAEFNSPTYTGITLACMADIVEFARDEEARALALRIEQQTWYDMCARFHPGSSNMGGPSSRAYMADSCGQMHNGRFPVHVAFGEEVQPLSPLRISYGKRNDLAMHHNKPEFIPANGAWLAAPTFHVPEACEDLMTSRRYPFEAVGTAACAFTWRPDDWRTEADGKRVRFRPFEPFRFAPVHMHTYQTADISMSTSTGAHACGSGGQHDHFFLTYRKRVPEAVQGLTYEDVRTVFCRYDFNGHDPHTDLGLVNDYGRKAAVQHRHTAIIVYRPGIEVLHGIESMRAMIILPLHSGEVDAVWIGNQKLDGIEGESESPETVFVRDGQVMLGFRPLDVTNYGRPVAVRTARVDKFLTISFYNYEGDPRSLNFPYQAALFTQNGFVADAAVVDSDADADAFRTRLVDATLSDEIGQGIRRVHFKRDDVDLRIEVDPTNEGVITPAWVNGEPLDSPRYKTSNGLELPWPER